MIIDIRDIATRLMTSGIQGEFAKQMWAQWEYRKGKNIQHLKHARVKAVRAGIAKLECEIDFAELYVKDVLKKRRRADKYQWDSASKQLFCRSCGNNYLLKKHKPDCVYVIRGDKDVQV
jgi:hypothetical protein